MANDTEFGLAAYFCSCDIGRIWRIAEALEYGIEEFLEVKYLCMRSIDR
jgi:acyl-CoA reductase-like NAD-dependent aldehyde dehydrogenase